MFKTIIKMREDNTHIIATYTTTLFGLVVRVREIYIHGARRVV